MRLVAGSGCCCVGMVVNADGQIPHTETLGAAAENVRRVDHGDTTHPDTEKQAYLASIVVLSRY